MTRVLGFELRRSNAPSLAVLLVAAGLGALALGGNLGLDGWHGFTYAHTSSLFLLLPLALAGGAVMGRRERRSRADELIASTGRPRAQRLLPGLLALAVAAALAHLIVFAGGAIVILVTGAYANAFTVLWPLAGVLVLAGGAWLGLAAGRAWSSPLVPPLVAVLGLLLQFGFAEFGPPGEPTRWENLAMLPQPPLYDWEAVTGRAVLGYAVLGAGLIAAGFLLASGRSWLPRVAAVAALAVAGTLAAVIPGTTAATHYRVDAAAQKLVCADGAPQVCVTAVHATVLDEAAPRVREALSLLAKLPGAPTRAVEWRADRVYQPGDSDWQGTGTTRPEPGTMNFDLGLDDGRLSPALVETIVLGAGTLWNGCPGGQDLVAAHAAGAWLMGRDELTGVDDTLSFYPELKAQVPQTVRALRALPEPEQIRRVTALRDASLNCQEDLLPLLTGASS
ncbi:hypothetical protein [Actinoplanes sp. M2I2]|uniref:hypothetical protein n=1 Tax=Actinoplanes sp. M2I2 TaxID=1734444 RepID=UPI002020C145|nr:hypothetical protein [Actinoplanes sp. M2I2]